MGSKRRQPRSGVGKHLFVVRSMEVPSQVPDVGFKIGIDRGAGYAQGAY